MNSRDSRGLPSVSFTARLGAMFSYSYQLFRQFLRDVIPYTYRRRAVRFARTYLRRASASNSAASLRAMQSLLERTTPQKYDVICFPIIDWDFRFQRPQQLMSRFAAAGHRVFYLNQNFRDYGPPYELQMKCPNVYEVSLRGQDLHVYSETLDPKALDILMNALDALRRTLSFGATVAFVQLPFWYPLAVRARDQFGWPIIYDCMDYHAGFSTNQPKMLEEENGLVVTADCVLASSHFLAQAIKGRARTMLMVRNGCDYEHFAQVRLRARTARPVIGYYGAIADWFDAELVADLAERHPEWDFVLVGSTFTADLRRLSALANVSLPGEQAYADLPAWLETFDVLILPFKRTPLTEATNPVKAYEIFAAGKPLVAVPIIEMKELAPLARLASNATEFEREISAALAEDKVELVEARRAFARENTWQKRFETLLPAVNETFPLASIIVVTYNNLELNRLCLQSLYTNTEWPHFEVIVIDNASNDETREFLIEATEQYPNLKVIFNERNLGFAAANNQGLKEARGKYLVLLNNDTVVPRGWLTKLIHHLATDHQIGLIGPVTNEIGNEAKIPVTYTQLYEMPAWATEYMRAHDGETFTIPMLAMFCVAMRREVFERIGFLDERFGIGMFEDDDYTRRMRAAGYKMLCARDSFVHHAGSASFNKLASEAYYELFERNRGLYEEKWGEVWRPHEDGIAKAQIPALRAQLQQILKEAERTALRTFIFLPGESWHGVTPGRRHRLAQALARCGCLVFFDCSGSQRDDFAGFTQLAPRLWLYKGPSDVLGNISHPTLWARADQAPLIRQWAQASVIYDWTTDLANRFHKGHAQLLAEANLVICATSEDLITLQMARQDALYLSDSDDLSSKSAQQLLTYLQLQAKRS